MKLLGSLLYLIIQSLVTPLFAVLMVLSAFIDRHTLPKLLAKYWCTFMLWCGVFLRRVRFSVSGLEHLPSTPCVILSKHQSEWETLFLPAVLPPHVMVLKQELLKIPFFGWGLKLLEPIAIDRSQKKAALEQVIRQGIARLEQGLYVVIFPEGTRVKVGYKGRYAQSGAQLATKAQVPIIPVAHNAGVYWPKGLFKQPGIITVRFGEPISTDNKTAAQVIAEVETWIESNMEQITGHPAQDLRKTPSQALTKKKPRELTINIDEKIIPYRIVRRKNRKTIGLIMDHQGLSVAIPQWVSLQQVEEALRQQHQWITHKYQAWQSQPKPIAPSWNEGSSIPWLGNSKTIVFHEGQQLSLFADQDTFIRINNTEGDVKNTVIKAYREAILPILKEDIEYFCDQLKIHPIPTFTISNAQTRWGSCSEKGQLRFNWRLMKASRDEIRYVVAHEIAHLFEFNHGPKFWQLVERIYPQYRSAKERLKKNDSLYRQF
ncbi:1-acyl-sn-glycerol-3-phosphate acyltransferase [Ferrovum sp. JA12]|uniref:YgjP-like metallopeptidase domain-containing protein n=1 Tax=Ferrovum sp. JA12 TaxID=1356299 RepID=UPI000702E79B|nr:YgjP-like metallopeptidase domain-containing protein [Ferrovum sp. JA12]KRH79131.1 1-acyl-sn-glycerol-3-phosphate acyltransferase [Ferrovum sp. JA12]